jgi:FtsP/CotA-like multicopper oxidase with cupredoxin domain
MKRLLLAFAVMGFVAAGTAAQPVTCPPPSNDFVKVPELVSSGGKLKATIIAVEQQQCISVRVPPTLQTADSKSVWHPQIVRTMRGVGAVPDAPAVPPNTYPYPLPAPTLRARVGELVELTFLNQIDPNRFPYSIDQAEKPGGGCDETTLYPGTRADRDQFPNCFHGSSTANLHFHGTHVNPNSTGDNVFVEIRPFPRSTGQPSTPLMNRNLQRWFDEQFFPRCEFELKPENPTRQWPFVWEDLPLDYRGYQTGLLETYDSISGLKLSEVNAGQIARKQWPQYYIGAYPYCYRIPNYTSKRFPPGLPENVISGPDGTAHQHAIPEGTLLMGQSPGTHWYHAHKHGSTAINVANGMTGAFIIEGQYDDDLNAFYGKDWTRRQPVIVIQQIDVGPNLERGGGGLSAKTKQPLGQDSGPSFSVNGRLAPILRMAPGEVQLWRLINSSPRAGVYLEGPPTGFHWRQTAQDGVQFSGSNYKDPSNVDGTIYLASGNRADLLVMAPPQATQMPVSILAQNLVDPTEHTMPSATDPSRLRFVKNPLLSVMVTGTPAKGNTAKFIDKAPDFPPFLTDILAGEVQGTKSVVFSSEYPDGNPPPAIHKIDGHLFDGKVGKMVMLNTVEEWKVSNETYGTLIAHPFHIHLNPFQVVEVFAPNEELDVKDPDTGAFLKRYVFDPKAVKVKGRQCLLDPRDPDTWRPCDDGKPKRPGNAPNYVWYDVFPIPSGTLATDAHGHAINDAAGKQVRVPGYFRMRSRFVDYSGFYVLHCHILGHEDRGMLTIVRVTPSDLPFVHH